MSLRLACVALVMLLMGGASGCLMQQGQRPVMTPEDRYAQILDMVERGDLVAASSLIDGLRKREPASVFGVLATLERYRIGTDRIDASRVGARHTVRGSDPVDLCTP